jgi:hypothetical protein
MINKYSAPGWISDRQCDLITELVSTLPENAKILEIGTAFGKSSLSILDGMTPNQTLDVCDLWEKSHWTDMVNDMKYARTTLFGDKRLINNSLNILATKGIRKAWESNVMQHPNSNLIKNVFQQTSMSLIDTNYDLVFLDGEHSYSNLSNELKKFRNVPIICGDDFSYHIGNDVIKAVIDFGKEFHKVLTVDLQALFYVLRNKK